MHQSLESASLALSIAKQLIERPSISPFDHGCQIIIAEFLKKIQFSVEKIGSNSIDNLWARRGSTAPLFVFAGHTDVVPPGPLEVWNSDPFIPLEQDGFLYGRGAADMKTAIAVMLAACQRFYSNYSEIKGSIGFLITSCEEETTPYGTLATIQQLYDRQEQIDWCVVGEAASEKKIGDQIKYGRRGSLNGELIIFGVQGHIAYPQQAKNPIHHALKALQTLTEEVWDHGDQHFSPTCLQISNIIAGTGATNVIPGELKITFNFRYSPSVTAEQLMERVENILKKFEIKYNLEWFPSAKPFVTIQGRLMDEAKKAIQDIAGQIPILSTSGGTSDARFIAPMGVQVLEIGFINETIHKANECVAIKDIATLEAIYFRLLERLFVYRK